MISLEQASVEYDGELLFGDVSFMLRQKEKVGLVGNNGSGKTTLLKIIHGDMAPTGGKVNIPSDIKIGYLPQHMVHQEDQTVYLSVFNSLKQISGLDADIRKLNQSVVEREDYQSDEYSRILDDLKAKTEEYHLLGGDKVESDIERTLTGLGFNREDLNQPLSVFSGGWKMRVELAKILLNEPDVLLLDEPTNHLDIESIQWFENYLVGFQGAVMLISHDRAFLDNVTSRTLELSLGKLYDFKLPYSKYRIERENLRQQQMAAYKNQQKKIKETEEFIERFRYKANKASLVQSRIKQLEKMQEVQVDEEDNKQMHIRFPDPPRSGREVLKAGNIVKYYGDHLVLDDVDFLIERGERVAFVGRNGEGKTTMAKVLLGKTDYEGSVTVGYNVEIGYYAQNQDELLDDDLTVFQTLDNIAEGEMRKKVRPILGAFLFEGEDVNKKVRVLSGGERSRLALAKLLLHPYNMLILDEPTNHLDIQSKEILKQALNDYGGTLLLVSHDRDFLDGLVSKVYEFRHRKMQEHIGGIYDFLEKKKLDELDDLNTPSKVTRNTANSEGKTQTGVDHEQRKEQNRKVRKVEKEIAQCEQRIEELEYKMEEMEKALASPEKADNHDLYSQYEELKQEHETEMNRWEQLHGELEQLKF
ncbi:MAG: ABC-F family ATP-binding cassette domain-containing protein [Bacteroidales bacterium]|nr:ABC-F family ATP-binding cassette domain-containing protein [Bacteroidales bacterium]